jgi:hypothetical protein
LGLTSQGVSPEGSLAKLTTVFASLIGEAPGSGTSTADTRICECV